MSSSPGHGDGGYAAWARSIGPTVESEWKDWDGRDELVEVCSGDVLLAYGVYWLVGKNYLAWLDARPGVLEGRTPRDCLKSADGVRTLKAALLRQP